MRANIPVPILRGSIPFRPDFLVVWRTDQKMGPDFPGTQWGDEIPEDAVFYKFRFHLSEAARPYVEAAGLDPNSGFSRISIEFDAMSADPATIELEQTAKWLLDARDIEARKTPLHKLAEEADA